MKLLRIQSDILRIAVITRVYDTISAMRSARTKFVKRYIKKEKDVLRPSDKCAAGCIFYYGSEIEGQHSYLTFQVFLRKNQSTAVFVDDMAHEFSHVAQMFVEEGEKYKYLRLLAKDSKIKKANKREEAISTIVGGLTGIFYEWAIEDDYNVDEKHEDNYTPILFPSDLWRTPCNWDD